jgi:uncharacterized protein (TIGR02996 family)
VPPPRPSGLLEDAAGAAGRGDWPGALSALLAAWRAARDPELAALIERVSARGAGPPVAGPGSATANLRRRIAAATDADVGPILELALRQIRTFPRAYHFVVELAESRPPDPRAAAALAAVIEQPPFVDRDGALYPDVVTALDRIDDPRFRDLLVTRWRALEPQRGRIRKYRAALDVLEQVARKIEDREAPTANRGLAAAIARIDEELARVTPRQRKQARDAGALLEAIRANPADVSLRLVYADALQENGDPRGELIALQCGRGDAPPSKRERELLATYARAWLGEIEPIVMKQGVVFRRGFLACAREGVKKIAQHELLESPEWITLEELAVSVYGDEAVAFLADPRWKVLRRVYNVYGPDLSALAKRTEALPWTAFGPRYVPDGTWPIVDRLFPALEELDLAQVDLPAPHLAAIGALPLRDRLRRVRVWTRFAPWGAVAEAARAAGIAELEMVPAYTFPGAPAGHALRLAGDALTLVHHELRVDTSYAAAALGELPVGAIRSVALEAPPKARIEGDAWAGLQRALKRHRLALAKPANSVIVER